MRSYEYDAQILAALGGHGLKPRPATSPEQLRDALRDLYRYEIRALRNRLLDGRIERVDYAGEVVALRKRYWLLSVPTAMWTVE